jgi:hypothetical protein
MVSLTGAAVTKGMHTNSSISVIRTVERMDNMGEAPSGMKSISRIKHTGEIIPPL